jgi:hypothetical protein
MLRSRPTPACTHYPLHSLPALFAGEDRGRKELGGTETMGGKKRCLNGSWEPMVSWGKKEN